MILKNHYIKALLLVTSIVLSGVIFGIVLQHLQNGYYFTMAGIIILILVQAYLLVGLVNKTNKDLEKFFSSVRDHDSTIRFSEEKEIKSFRHLYNRMNNVNAVIQAVRIENERTRYFLQSVVDHIDIGLLSFDVNGRIDIFNKAAGKYLNVQKSGQLAVLKTDNNDLYEIINTIRPGQEVLHRIKRDNYLQSVLVKATELNFENRILKLVSFADITSELEKKEVDSWQKLIRVLTHEIMNSVSPITSLSSLISGYFRQKGSDKPVHPETIDINTIRKTLSGLDTIQETGRGLLDFVDKYRSLTLLPKPHLTRFTIESLFMKCKLLMESGTPGDIRIQMNTMPGDIALNADYSQVEQVMINLIRNSFEALCGKQNPVIKLDAFTDNESIIVRISDNGTGIPEDIIEDVFIPFYTTKENGSGIGLSLSKQIMQNHKGTISIAAVPGGGTRVTLKFPQAG